MPQTIQHINLQQIAKKLFVGNNEWRSLSGDFVFDEYGLHTHRQASTKTYVILALGKTLQRRRLQNHLKECAKTRN